MTWRQLIQQILAWQNDLDESVNVRVIYRDLMMCVIDKETRTADGDSLRLATGSLVIEGDELILERGRYVSKPKETASVTAESRPRE